MAKKMKFRRRRASTRAPRKAPSKFTLIKLIKVGIALGPVTAKAITAYKANGGGTNGFAKGALPAFVSSYTGYNTNDGKFYANDLVTGYVPLLGAWVFGKVASRVVRL